MFELVYNSLHAFNALGLTLGGLLLLAIALAIVADFTWWRLRARRFNGTIVAVRVKARGGRNRSEQYAPVIEYVNAEGQRITADSDSSSTYLANKVPGRELKILVLPRDPRTARIIGYAWPLIALLLGLPGIILLGVGIKGLELNPYTFLIALLLAAYAAVKLKKIVKPRSEWESTDQFRARLRTRRGERLAKMPLIDREQVLERLAERDRKNRKWLPGMIAAGFLLIGLGLYLGQTMQQRLAGSVAAAGRVVALHSEYNAGGNGASYTYYPVVVFTLPDGAKVRFRGNTGSNPPAYEKGERVRVLYPPLLPQEAMIDQGFLNWLPAAVCLALGILLTWLGGASWLGVRQRMGGLTP